MKTTKETADQDIVERLREWQNDDGSIEGLMTGAADEIERLRTGNRLHLELAEIKEGEIERLREALQNILSVQPIKDNEGSADIISLAKALLEIDSIARVTLKEKE